MEKGPEQGKGGQENEVDRARRRLLKLAVWVPPAILSLTSRTAWAQAKTSKAAAA
jgi:hypothetical protein